LKDQKKIGLYRKFTVTRKDGRHKKGEKHHGCLYFVLDLTHDPFVWKALECYAIECKADSTTSLEPNPRLSKQLFGLLAKHYGIALPGRDLVETDEDKKFEGLDDRYLVSRVDGRSKKGEKYHGCDYFVLDMTHDRYAMSAVEQYGMACKQEYPKLATDLFYLMDRRCPDCLLPGGHKLLWGANIGKDRESVRS
jgi:hypothetical protein